MRAEARARQLSTAPVPYRFPMALTPLWTSLASAGQWYPEQTCPLDATWQNQTTSVAERDWHERITQHRCSTPNPVEKKS